MSSQLDLDQGGTSRLWDKQYLGPSIGWVQGPVRNILLITTAGTFTVDPSVSLVTVNVAGLVTVVLPSVANPPAGAGALPGLFIDNPITIVDIGGHALTTAITIQPFAGQNIMGLSSIQITVNFGGYTLLPNAAALGWNSISP